mmetsp:Transcript_44939/g.66114  ORF Transcript_44939/g.66114 Transcript_44939/m.66114 type:complete len:134 (-) Transcript_44939:359-760(-)|eukprot:CAMPEP_0195516958 /NCGR_PEP_ID=MMETSP0794_2-20130614/9366_1 /TAXON_ID=515487 /ORGANISM="Stephanopyxis turris, Strain CCMP 815" /LENGTH=133 /DNA_ID=CAMNT_0040645677 /DNA_START=108 /DNA_END=509 /DNA_ORIENTATION=+
MGEEKKEFTEEEVGKHTEQDDIWLIIGNASTGGPKVYDVTQYLDDHPGGAEVLLDLAGKDADEFFEDIGHSQDARNELAKYEIGTLKIDAAKLAQMEEEKRLKAEKVAGGPNMVLIVLVILLAVAFGYFKTQM